MIEKYKFFELADPTFILSVVRKFGKILATPKDKICKEGEDAKYFYFIKEGKVKVLAKGEIETLTLLK